MLLTTGTVIGRVGNQHSFPPDPESESGSTDPISLEK